MPDPLASPSVYAAFIYGLPDRFPSIQRSTLIYVASGSLFGRVQGRSSLRETSFSASRNS